MSKAKNHSMRRVAPKETPQAAPEAPPVADPYNTPERELGPAIAVVLVRGVYRRVEFALTVGMLDAIAPTAKLSTPHSRAVILDPLVIRDSLHKRLKLYERVK